ncbi:uncharacterized protein FTJAE_9750 [Fusarium tjaetaba]|uniref:Helicase ATP-binding domain-containing protein n=1 Tax=Fusarium tjaetaba TaxID=1567544 RepID=A0A8H5VL74_9HYPO|nr:uncharacterized protein FTJAE_9750 [Fusarium tjaetaba]KAF5626283.1 hypothetical protein FTJAE_9750 [Fusarium tjaetaba]
MAYRKTSHGSVYALFEASFQKPTDAVSSDTSTASHKAHCSRVDASSNALIQRHILVGGRHGDLPVLVYLAIRGTIDFYVHLNIFDALKTELKYWQRTGVGKLVWLANSSFKGGFLADAMGRGKSLQAMVAALEVKRTMPTRSGFIAIVTRAGCVIQWANEIKRHFKPEHCPSWIIIDDAKIDTTRRLEYDIVISSREFLKSRYRDSLTFEHFCHVRVALGLTEAQKIKAGRVQRPNLVLHSDYYSQINRNIAVLILDESHGCRNDESVYFDAVKSLKYHHLFMLSGTPMFNQFHDIVGQSRLLPGGGLFSNMKHFRSLFYEHEDQRSPTGPKYHLFTRLYQGLMVALPKSMVKLISMKGVESKKDSS